MKTHLLTTIAALLLTHTPLHAANFTWDGGALFGDVDWSNALNWATNIPPPSDGTADLFFAGSTKLNANADSAWSVKSLTFNLGAGHFQIQGSPLTLGSGGVTNSGGIEQDIFNNLILGAAQTFNTTSAGTLDINGTVSNGGNLLTVDSDAATGAVRFFGIVSGTGGLTKTGTGTLRFEGATANIYSGATTVSAGSLELAKTAGVNAIAGALNLSGSASVVWQASNQIANTSAVSLTNSSGLNFNGFSESIGSLSLTTSTVQTGAGTLTLNGTVTSFSTNVSQILGALDLGGGARTFNVANNAVAEKDLIVTATIANGSLVKSGLGTLFLSGANTFAGGVTVSAGELMAGSTSALGTGTLTLATGGAIRSEVTALTVANPVAISGDATYSGIRDLTFSGAATMNGSRTLNVTNSNQTIFSGIVSSNAALGGLTKTGAGILTFSGPNANTYVGSTFVNDGLLILGKTAGVTAILSASLTIGDGTHAATVQLNASNQIANSSNVFINADSRLDLGNFSEQIAGLTLNAATVSAGGGVLTIGGNVSTTGTCVISSEINLGGATRTFTVGAAPFEVDLNAPGAISNGGIVKDGVGALSLGAFASTFSGGLTVNAGEVALGSDTSAGSGPLVLNDTATVRSIEGPIVLANVLTIGGNITVSGSQDIAFGGATTLTGTRTITTTNTALTSINGAIGQDVAGRGFVKAGLRTLSLGGTAANTFTGSATVNEGTLLLNKPAGVNAIAGSALIIGDGSGGSNADVVRLLASNQIGNAMPVTVRASGLLDLNNHDETIPSLSLEAGQVFTGTGLLTVTGPIDALTASNSAIINGHLSLGGGTRTITVANGSGTFDMFLDASVENGSITKTGAGLLAITGLQTYSALLAQAGMTKLFTPLGTGTSTVNVTPTGASATVFFNTSQTLASLTIGNGGVVIVDNEPAPAPPLAFDESAIAETQTVPEPGSGLLAAFGWIVAAASRRSHFLRPPRH